jgi:hypothetical protein
MAEYYHYQNLYEIAQVLETKFHCEKSFHTIISCILPFCSDESFIEHKKQYEKILKVISGSITFEKILETDIYFHNPHQVPVNFVFKPLNHGDFNSYYCSFTHYFCEKCGNYDNFKLYFRNLSFQPRFKYYKYICYCNSESDNKFDDYYNEYDRYFDEYEQFPDWNSNDEHEQVLMQDQTPDWNSNYENDDLSYCIEPVVDDYDISDDIEESSNIQVEIDSIYDHYYDPNPRKHKNKK